MGKTIDLCVNVFIKMNFHKSNEFKWNMMEKSGESYSKFIFWKKFLMNSHYIIKKKNNQAVKPSYGISSIGTYSPQYLDPCYLYIIT